MDEDYGTDLANAQADDDWCEENGICPLCRLKYDYDGNCGCNDEY